MIRLPGPEYDKMVREVLESLKANLNPEWELVSNSNRGSWGICEKGKVLITIGLKIRTDNFQPCSFGCYRIRDHQLIECGLSKRDLSETLEILLGRR